MIAATPAPLPTFWSALLLPHYFWAYGTVRKRRVPPQCIALGQRRRLPFSRRNVSAPRPAPKSHCNSAAKQSSRSPRTCLEDGLSLVCVEVQSPSVPVAEPAARNRDDPIATPPTRFLNSTARLRITARVSSPEEGANSSPSPNPIPMPPMRLAARAPQSL